MKNNKTILHKTQLLWQLIKVVECMLYAAGLGVFLSFFVSLLISILAALIALAFFIVLFKPFNITLANASNLIDRKYPSAENSSSLLIRERNDLSLLAKFQADKMAKLNIKLPAPPNNLVSACMFLVFMAIAGFSIAYFLPKAGTNGAIAYVESQDEDENLISKADKLQPPAIRKASVKIMPPNYTGIINQTTNKLQLKVIKQSVVNWKLTANESVENIFLETSGQLKLKLKKNKNEFSTALQLKENGFYSFRLVAKNGEERTTEFYQIQVIEDEPPVITLKGIKQYVSIDYTDSKLINFSTTISDDFKITDAYIIATVSKGSGESVKFREEKLSFNDQSVQNKKLVNLKKSIDLDAMKLTPGDELYFYVEAFDNHMPNYQKSRTETYFLSIRDTTEIEFSLAGGLGVDLMPEYFRSQRQIIIDTEKLIEEREQLSKNEFNSKSNELGFDQKTLRLKYGQFMGEESESGIDVEPEIVAKDLDTDDPLAEYTHDHDGDNEHNLVSGDLKTSQEGNEEDPLHDYVHDHDDPEEATLYTQSMRSMLKQAMAEMWDAELYLRLYQPKKSLPYQYKALELIKKIKNHARIYVHRIGFDPPPIKEDKRLTGDLDEVESNTETNDIDNKDELVSIRLMIERVEELVLKDEIDLKTSDFILFERAGEAFAPLAVAQPVKYLKTLELLKKMANNEIETNELRAKLKLVNIMLYEALPEKSNYSSGEVASDPLSAAYLRNLTETERE